MVPSNTESKPNPFLLIVARGRANRAFPRRAWAFSLLALAFLLFAWVPIAVVASAPEFAPPPPPETASRPETVGARFPPDAVAPAVAHRVHPSAVAPLYPADFVSTRVLERLVAEMESLSLDRDTRTPSLLVVATFDHFRPDFLTRFASQFGDDGFRRMMREGVWARDFSYRNAIVTSAPGHAALATGAYPDRTGIVGDARFDPSTGRIVGSVEDPAERLVAGRGIRAGRAGVSPRALTAPTLADSLRTATDGRARVVALGMSDHAAVLLGGARPHRALWWDAATAQFVSSSHYTEQLDVWMLLFNDVLRFRDHADSVWDLLHPESWYSISRRDDAPYEFSLPGRTFPHRVVPEGRAAASLDPVETYRRLTATPLGDDLLLDMAGKVLGADRLGMGAGDVPDLLYLSFGASASVGRGFGPFSREAHDMALRTDRLVASLLRMLDRLYGPERYALVVVGTGGIAPIPEAMAEHGLDAGRLHPGTLMETAEARLRARFPPDSDAADRHPFLTAFVSSWVWLNADSIRARGLSMRDVREALRDILAAQEDVAAAYTVDQLAEGRFPRSDAYAEAFARDVAPGRVGDVVVLPRPLWIVSPTTEGTAAGTPHGYDRRTVLLGCGRGIARGVEIDEPVGAEDVAPTLAALLGVAAPPSAQGRLVPGFLRPPEKRDAPGKNHPTEDRSTEGRPTGD